MKTTPSLMAQLMGLLFLCSSLQAQKINTLADMMQILEKSTISYEISILEKEIPTPDRSNMLNMNDVYREDDVLKYYELTESATKLYEEAEAFFEKKDPVNARKKYLAALEESPKFYKIMTYVGQTYEQEDNYEEAIKWFQKAIANNPIDYMPHWFLADAYFLLGRIDLAVEAITVAQILNRNNPRIETALERIYKAAKLQTKKWSFNPQIELDSIGVNKVRIASSGGCWMSYAIAKAVWKYEPDYSESRGVKPGTASTKEEMECLYSLVLGAKKNELKKNLSLKALQIAIEKKYLSEYILYEILLPNYPRAACLLAEEVIVDIKKYVLEVRGKLK